LYELIMWCNGRSRIKLIVRSIKYYDISPLFEDLSKGVLVAEVDAFMINGLRDNFACPQKFTLLELVAQFQHMLI